MDPEKSDDESLTDVNSGRRGAPQPEESSTDETEQTLDLTGHSQDVNEQTLDLSFNADHGTVKIPDSGDSGSFSISAGAGTMRDAGDGDQTKTDLTAETLDPVQLQAQLEADSEDDSHRGGDPNQSSQPFGMGEKREPIDKTVENIEGTIDMRTVQLRPQAHQTRVGKGRTSGPSVMNSPNTSQTIDPRALSKADAAFWGSAAVGASVANRQEASQLKPAIERSIAESNLQIRVRDLAVPTQDSESPSDYRLVRLLGRGGMGNVYVARQGSLDRMIAVKVIRPLPKAKRKALTESGRLEEVEHERRQQFVSEAVVTGDLDHPNIVPIHDIAVAADNTLFYAMKRVVGEPWSKTIENLGREENLDVLLKVCDAIAFAHTRGVIHRDIKPENIMLGDFGEVLVMDWGLALAQPEFEKKDSISGTVGLGGTPAFMAPEMAIGPVSAIGAHSDIYLLGATLYYIIVGHAPHKAENVSQCLRAVTANKIVQAPENCRGELLDIAIKAMATKPGDRHESVKAFQQAIRSYRSHSESVALSSLAETDYAHAVQTGRYEEFSRATHGFEQAIKLWEGNLPASEGLARCKIDHATAAYKNGDYDLGLSLLSADEKDHQPLINQLNIAIDERDQRAGRLKAFRRGLVAALAFIFVGGTAALYTINEEKRIAEQSAIAEAAAKIDAEQARDSESLARGVAEQSRDDALKSKLAEQVAKERALLNQKLAEDEKSRAEASERNALASRNLALYESYLSQIGLAKARIGGNEFDEARRILEGIRVLVETETGEASSLAWEWRYLWQLANQSRSALRFSAGVVGVAADPRGRFAFAVSTEGSVIRSALDLMGSGGAQPDWVRDGLEATCIAIAEEGLELAVGTRTGSILVLDPNTGEQIRQLEGHDSVVTDLEYLEDGRLLSGSRDRTVALWLPTSQTPVDRCWHIAPVVDIASAKAGNDGSLMVLSASSDAKSGRVAGWALSGGRFVQTGEFTGHEFPVVSVAFASDGKTAASGDTRGTICLWDPEALRRTDYQGSIEDAITRIRDAAADDVERQVVAARPLEQADFVSWQAHEDAIRALEFDRGDVNVLSASDDYTIRAWRVNDHSLAYSLRGHGGWVRALSLAATVGGDASEWIVSGSVDGTLRTWEPPVGVSGTVETLDVPQSAATVRLGGGPATAVLSVTRENQLHGDEILAASLDQSGRRMISASRDHTARVLGIDRKSMSFRELARLNTKEESRSELNEGSEFLAMSAKIDTVGRRLFIGNADATIRVWDLESGIQLGALDGTGLNDAFALSKNGRRLLSGSSRPEAKAMVWDVDPSSGESVVIHRLAQHEQAVTAFALSEDGSVMATGDRDGRCLIWDGDSGQLVGDPIDFYRGYRINDLSMSKDGKSIWLATDSGVLAEIDLATRERKQRLEHEGFVTQVSFSADADQAVTVESTRTKLAVITKAVLWDLGTKQSRVIDEVISELDEARQASGDSARITSARFGDYGNSVVICEQQKGGRTGRATIYDLNNRRIKGFDLPSQIGAPELGLLWGPDRLITLNGEAGFRWSINALVHEKSYRPHAAVTQARFSPDGKIAITASRSIRMWDSVTGDAIDKLEAPHEGAVVGLDVTSLPGASGYLIVTCGEDGRSARLWAWKDGNTGFELMHDLEFEDAEVSVVRFSPDGKRLMLAGTNSVVRLWSVETRTWERSIELPEGLGVTCARFSADGRSLALGCSDRAARLYSILDKDAVPCEMRGHADRIESICVLQDASGKERVLTASRDKSVRVWDPRPTQSASANEPVVSDDGESDRAADRKSESSEIKPPAAPVVGREVLTLRRHSQGVTAVDCTSDGELVVTAGRDGRVLLWAASSP